MSQDHHNRQGHKRNNQIAFARTQVRDAAQRTVKRYYQYGKAAVWLTLTPFRAWWNLPGGRKNVISTGVIALATVSYAIYGGLLWSTTDENTIATKHTAEAVQTQVSVMQSQLEAPQRPRFDATNVEL